MTRRQMHLIAYLKTGPTAQHTGGWRHPESTLDDILEPSRYEYIARLLESAKFDGCFFADLFGLYDVHQGSFDAYVRHGDYNRIFIRDAYFAKAPRERATTLIHETAHLWFKDNTGDGHPGDREVAPCPGIR